MLLNKIIQNDHLLLYTCMDRITGEDVPFLIDNVMAIGAKNINVIPSLGKKGRHVYLVFVDCTQEFMREIIEYMVLNYQTTGWHIIDTIHEHVIPEDVCIELDFKYSGNVYPVEVPVKYLETDDNDYIIFLENDYCEELYNKILEISAIEKKYKNISIRQIKNKLENQLRKILLEGACV